MDVFPIYSYNRSKTHCKRNHAYIEGLFKVRADKRGHVHRECIPCRQIKERQRRSGAPEPEIVDPNWADYDDDWLSTWPEIGANT